MKLAQVRRGPLRVRACDVPPPKPQRNIKTVLRDFNNERRGLNDDHISVIKGLAERNDRLIKSVGEDQKTLLADTLRILQGIAKEEWFLVVHAMESLCEQVQPDEKKEDEKK
jgi:hypothetical protein